MPIKSYSNPSFIRPAEIMGADIQAALATKAEEIAGLVAEGKKGSITKAKAVLRTVYDENGLAAANKARLVRVMNRGADEVSDSAILKTQRPRLNGIIDTLGEVVQKSADRYLDRIVLKRVAALIAKGGSPDDVHLAVKKSLEDAEHYWKNVSNTASSRIFHYSSMLAAQGSGLTYCTYHAVIDDRTTDFCKSIDGKRITLANAIVKAEDLLSKTSDEMLDSDIWAITENLAANGSTALVTKGVTLPPFHGHCRTTTQFS